MAVEDYRIYLAELEDELAKLQNTDIDAVVEKRMEILKEQVKEEEIASKNKAIYEKQIGIGYVKRRIAELEATVIVNADQPEQENFEEGE